MTELQLVCVIVLSVTFSFLVLFCFFAKTTKPVVNTQLFLCAQMIQNPEQDLKYKSAARP